MADSIGGIPRLILPAGEEKPDPLHAIARRLFPLVRSRPDWWREAVRRWASDPPLHNDSPLINTKMLRERLAAESKQRGQREKDETDDAWKRRQVILTEARKRAKELLAKLQSLDEGASLLDDKDCRMLPIPFTDETTTRDERIALLAAIHDTYATADARIDPWGDLPQLTEADIEMTVPWWVLFRDRVPKLREYWDTHEASVEMFIADIESELAGQPTDKKPKRRGPKKADYATVENEAELAADWKQARDADTYKADFAKDHGMTLKEFDKLLDRVAWRQRPSE